MSTYYSGPRVTYIPAQPQYSPPWTPPVLAAPVMLYGSNYGLGAATQTSTALYNAKIYASNSLTAGGLPSSAVIGTVPKGTKVIINSLGSKMSNVQWLGHAEGYIWNSDFSSPTSSSSGSTGTSPDSQIMELQKGLAELAALGYNTDPGTPDGIVGTKTLNAMANAVGIVAGDIKGGDIVAIGMSTALKLALTKGSITAETKAQVKSLAPALTIAIYAYVQKKRGNLPDGYNPDMGLGPTWTPATMALVALGTLTVIGGLYLLLRK